jgi:hypothetical protein
MACADLKHEKESVAAGYWRLLEKHKAFIKKTEQEKIELAEIHTTELGWLREDLHFEMCSYTEYHQNVRCQLRELHEMVASLFEEVKMQCLPFPGKGTKIGEMIDCVAGEVKTMPNTVW